MDFAKKLLSKYGWSDGQGLGKNNDGITKPLRANFKFDKAGLGENQAESDFNNHWWQRVYNDAAQNVVVKPTENGAVTAKLKADAESVEISTLSYSVKKLKKEKQKEISKDEQRYGNFMQTATLVNTGAEIVNENKVENIDVKKYEVLTDVELFAACGGRTAHKGARHGLDLKGKIKRLEQQELELYQSLQCAMKMEETERAKNRKEQYKDNVVDDVSKTRNLRKQHRKLEAQSNGIEVDNSALISISDSNNKISEETACIKQKNKKLESKQKSHKNKVEFAEAAEDAKSFDDDDHDIKRKTKNYRKQKRKLEQNGECEIEVNTVETLASESDDFETAPERKRKKKRDKKIKLNCTDKEVTTENASMTVLKKTKKKKSKIK